MSFDIPATIEPEIRQYAIAQHITEDQAIIQLLQVGLAGVQLPPKNPRAILGAFSSPEERSIMDEALELAMHDREHRHARIEHA